MSIRNDERGIDHPWRRFQDLNGTGKLRGVERGQVGGRAREGCPRLGWNSGKIEGAVTESVRHQQATRKEIRAFPKAARIGGNAREKFNFVSRVRLALQEQRNVGALAIR